VNRRRFLETALVVAGGASVSGCLRFQSTGTKTTRAERELTLELTGQQFSWTFDADDGLEPSTGRIVLPAATRLTVEAESDDVVHGFGISALEFGIDVVPGETTTGSFSVETVDGDTQIEGSGGGTFDADVYEGICTELCGAGHSEMTADVYVLEPEQYRSYVENAGGRVPPSMTR
jgi:cytochrome c oxidase subunit 2